MLCTPLRAVGYHYSYSCPKFIPSLVSLCEATAKYDLTDLFCVGSPIFLCGVSNVVYSHTPLYHYKPAYPQHKAWYEFLRGTGYLIWPAGWQPCISLRPINRRDSCLFYPRSLLGYSQLSVDQGLSTSPNTSEHPLTEEYLWLKRYIANDCIVLPVS